MDERDEQEIETRLRGAFMARSELVTHQKLRPGVPPNAHTAGARQAKRRGWAFSWRAALVPLSVTAALAGGVFVGAKLQDHKDDIRAGGPGPFQQSQNSGSLAPGATTDAPGATPGAVANTGPAALPPQTTLSGLTFAPADWQLTKLDDASACLQPKGHEPVDRAAVLPCGVDALWIQTNAAPDAWPVSTAKDKEGWWPKAGTFQSTGSGSATAPTVPCPAAKPSAKNSVKTSAALRADDKYPLAGTTIADYREWTVTCADGTGVLPKLWQIKGPAPIVVTAVSADARYDNALLGIVASMHPANG